MTTTESLSPQQAEQILQTMAAVDPDFAPFQAKFSDAPHTSHLEPEIIKETLAALNQDSQQAKAIKALRDNPDACPRFVSGAEVATLVAVTFLLRTHIKVERSSTGKWKFLIEHKPADSKLLTILLKKLEQLFGANS